MIIPKRGNKNWQFQKQNSKDDQDFTKNGHLKKCRYTLSQTCPDVLVQADTIMRHMLL